MTALAYLAIAAILIAWAIEALWQRIERRRDERDWQAMVDEAEHRAGRLHDDLTAMRADRDDCHRRALDAELGLGLYAAELERVEAERARVVPIKARAKKAAKAVGSK